MELILRQLNSMVSFDFFKKLKGEPFWEIFSTKSLTMPKKLKGVFQSCLVLYVTMKKEQPLWFSSLGQMVQFDTLKFRRTL